MATLRPNWFLISPVLTASGQFSLMTWNKSGGGQIAEGTQDRVSHTLDTHGE